MLDHIVNQDNIEKIGIRLRLEKISTQKIPFNAPLLKKQFGIGNLALRQINPKYIASKLGKRQQVSTFATTYFKNTAGTIETFESPNKIQIIRPGSRGQFSKVLLAIYVSAHNNGFLEYGHCLLFDG